MRLLRRTEDGTILVTHYTSHKDVPPYAVLSHTWGRDEDEATFQDLQTGAWQDKPLAVQKIRYCADQVDEDDLEYFWIDTCCIDKTSSSELQEAINSMFQWYQRAEVCYAYLSDVSLDAEMHALSPENIDNFKRSRWFTRGWTLQELLAPHQVMFFSAEWTLIGMRRDLGRHITDITGIPSRALSGLPLSQFSVKTRLSWGSARQTKRDEDAAYSLFGIFGVSMPLLYGEGKTKAMRRLNAEIKKEAQYLPSALVPSGEWSGYSSSSGEDTGSQYRPRRQSFVTSAPAAHLGVTVTPVGQLYTPQNNGEPRVRTMS
jgi:hypothetical protein